MTVKRLKIGVVGFSSELTPDQIETANDILSNFYEVTVNSYQQANPGDVIIVEVVSGYTALGIPLLAYQEAVEWDFETTGIACSKAENYECFPCDNVIIEGDEWGDESGTFLDYIDMLIKIGGGPQSKLEFDAYDGFKFDFEL